MSVNRDVEAGVAKAQMNRPPSATLIGLAVGVALGFAGAFGGIVAFVVVLVLAAVGLVVGLVIDGRIDLAALVDRDGKGR